MNTIIPLLRAAHRTRRSPSVTTPRFRQPNYDYRDLPDAVELEVYIPGSDVSGVDIEARGPDLLLLARKTHHVRANWASLHLEAVQRDYRLRLRLGSGLDYPAMEARLRDGILTLRIPKRPATIERSAVAAETLFSRQTEGRA